MNGRSRRTLLVSACPRTNGCLGFRSQRTLTACRGDLGDAWGHVGVYEWLKMVVEYDESTDKGCRARNGYARAHLASSDGKGKPLSQVSPFSQYSIATTGPTNPTARPSPHALFDVLYLFHVQLLPLRRSLPLPTSAVRPLSPPIFPLRIDRPRRCAPTTAKTSAAPGHPGPPPFGRPFQTSTSSPTGYEARSVRVFSKCPSSVERSAPAGSQLPESSRQRGKESACAASRTRRAW